jgi:hypothetical protein
MVIHVGFQAVVGQNRLFEFLERFFYRTGNTLPMPVQLQQKLMS